MATNKPKKKVIDGVVKPKSSAKASVKKVKAPFSEDDEKMNVHAAAGTFPVDKNTPDEGPADSSLEDLANDIIEESSETVAISADDSDVVIVQADTVTESPDAAANNISDDDMDDISDSAISEPEIENSDSNINISNQQNNEIDSDINESEDDVMKDIGLVSSAILEDDVIDQNLDDIINDIENEQAANSKKSKSAKSAEFTTAAATAAAAAAAEASAREDRAIAGITDSENIKKAERAKEKAEKSERAENTKQKEVKMKKSTQKEAKPFRIISRILAFIMSGTLITLATRVATTGIVPNKYLIPAIAGIAIVILFYLFKTFRKKTHVFVLVILDLLAVVLTAVSIFGFVKIDETMSFLNKNFGDDIEYSIYNVIVSKKSNYDNLDDVKGKTFHSITDFVDTERLEKAASEQADANIAYEDGITSLLKNAIDSTTYIAVLNSGTYDATIDADESGTYKDNLKVIGELKVEVEKKNNNSNSDLTSESFVVYISGIDTRSGLMLDRSLSDVNIVMAVNPKTKNILMVSIPRDYYVQLHGTSGLPDKLTHAGSLGGVQLSMSTIGDLLDVDFSRYIRVNFNFVVNLVDAIGGITVYSDVDYTFTTLHPENTKCTFHPGNNTVDGACALGFARERYSYSDGDRHRGRNQEQVIEKIFDKVTSSSTLISRYSDILNALTGSFDTNISTKDITSLANMQLSDMAKWTINSYNLDGTTGGAYTYSYPSQTLSVMFPDESTVKTAIEKIHQVLSGESISEPSVEN